MGFVESLPVQRIRPVLALPLYLGTLRDASGYGNHGTDNSASGHWATFGALDGYKNGRVDIAADPSLNFTAMTIFLSGVFDYGGATQYLVDSADHLSRLYITTTDLRFTGTGTSTYAPSITGARSLAVTVPHGVGTPQFYIDAVGGAGAGGTNNNTAGQSWHTPGFTGVEATCPVSCILVYSSVLAPAEILSLHNWSQSRITPRKQWPGSGLRYPDRGDPYTPRTGDPMYLDNIQTARVTLANVVAPAVQLSNTGLRAVTGIWALCEDDDGKYIHCIAAGQLQYGLEGADTFTTQLFTQEGGATLTKNPTNFEIDAGNGDIIRAVQLVA